MFVHLHTHSHYSLLDGLGKIDQLLDKAEEYKMPALALTDHGVMYGAIEFYKKARERGIKPIIGCEVYISPRSMQDKVAKIDTEPFHLVLLAKNYEGYKNLLQLVTQAHLYGFYYRPRIDKNLLQKYSSNLIALTACLQGEVPRLILNNNYEGAKKAALFYNEIFGQGNFYLELQDHQNLEDQKIVNKALIKMAQELNIPLVATNDIHYINKEDDDAQEILLCVQTGKILSDTNRLSMKGEDFSFKSSEEMQNAFRNIPEAIENSLKIAQMCDLEIPLHQIILPSYPLPPNETEKSYLEKLCYEGLKKRYGLNPPEKVVERLKYELSVIEKTNYESYFLIVADFVNWAKKNKIMVGPGRGSAAGSLVSYVLNITDLDPLKYGLFFERFLNPERIAPPDIDLDFADRRRDEVIEYVSQKYGQDRVAQIITFGTMEARQAVRDVGRVMGMAYSDVDKVAKLILPNLPLAESLKLVSELRMIYENDEQVKKLIEMAQKLEGVARHASVHAAGVVISKEPLVNYVPLQRAPKGENIIITQYSMYDLESLGLLKMDFLGLKNLTIIEDAIRIIRKTKNQEIDITKIPLDDKKTFQLLSRGETIGVFQLSSEGMRHYIKELKPTEFSDIVAMVALYRPGPMELIPDYIAGKHGKRKITYLHPKLEPILKETYGIVVYQEQVLQIARDLAGFTLGEADLLRKAIGKKIRELLIEQEEKFINGCIKNGISKNIAKKLFEFIEPFAHYGFNKAHAAAYAMIAYQTAYLKAHFPCEFMAALLTADQQNFDKLAADIAEAERMGIIVLPPDVNESFVDFGVVVDKGAIRFGLAAIKNVGRVPAEHIVEERKKNGSYKSIEDFVRRLGGILNKKILENLAKAGALDSLAERNQILAGMEQILKYAALCSKSIKNGQTDLFGYLGTEILPPLKLPEVPPAPKKQRLIWEKELLGMYVSEHPLDEFSEKLNGRVISINQLENDWEGRKVRLSGVISKVQKIVTKNSEIMLFVRLEDKSGTVEVLVFPKIYVQNQGIWQEGRTVVVDGRVNTKDGQLKIICENVKDLKKFLEEHPVKRIKIKFPPACSTETKQKIKELLVRFKGDVPVTIYLPNGNKDSYQELQTSCGLTPCDEVIKILTDLLGEEGFYLEKDV